MGNNSTKHSKDRPKKNVHWKSAEPPCPPGRPILVPGTEEQPDVVTITWEKPQYDGGSPIIGFIVEHRRMGSPHWVKATPILVPYPEISLSGLEPGWRYQFRIIAENAVGKSDPSELSDPLTVTLQRNAITPPHFTTELRDTVAIENEKIEFKVNVVGTPTPQVSWFKDGFEMFSSRRTKISMENTISSLVIHQAALTDEGEIKCTATNRAGHVVTRGKLTIEAPPKIRLPRQYEDGLIIEADEIVRLKVGIAGRPIPQILWYHNGEALLNEQKNEMNDIKHEITTTDKNTTLKITNIQRKDRGEYHIRASNKLGLDNASFLVTVTAKPEKPGKVSITMSLGKTVTLSWLAPNDDGGCKIGNYIVEYFRQGWNVWLKAATTRQLTTTLNDLIEGSDYKFRVKAENPYGLSEPSEESDILSIPGPKRTEVLNWDEVEKVKIAPDINELKLSNRSLKSTRFGPTILDSESVENQLSYGASDAVYKAKDLSFRSSSPVAETIKENSNLRNKTSEPIHNSSEFVLVLYPEKDKNSKKEETSSFDLNIEDAVPPPLSLSAPDLSAEPPAIPTMRHAVSSTELLYERAMSRFYQAVAYEESEKAKHRLSSDVTRPRSSSFEDLIRTHKKEPVSSSIKELIIDKQPKLEMSDSVEIESDHPDDYEEDYTDSTASSNESETEKFRRAVQSANIKPPPKNQIDEDDTYHPKDMMPRTITSYRSPDPNQAIEILTRPLPLPNPDFVPKPILKRPTDSNTTKSNKTVQKRRSLKKLFDRDSTKKKEPEEIKANGNLGEISKAKEIQQIKAAQEQKKLNELRQNSIEENKVVIDHYSDIVRERGITRPPKVPLYLDPEQLKLAADSEEEEERVEEQQIHNDIPSNNVSTDDLKHFFSRSPLVQRKYSDQMNSNSDIENIAPRISRKLTKDTSAALESTSNRLRQNTSKDRTRSRSSSKTRPSGQTATTTNRRNPSQSPVVKNRLKLDGNKMIENHHSNNNNSKQEINITNHIGGVNDEIVTQQKVKSTMNYFTDLALFFVACWLYFFSDPRFALIIILLMVYRQISDAIKSHLPSWMKGKQS